MEDNEKPRAECRLAIQQAIDCIKRRQTSFIITTVVGLLLTFGAALLYGADKLGSKADRNLVVQIAKSASDIKESVAEMKSIVKAIEKDGDRRESDIKENKERIRDLERGH